MIFIWYSREQAWFDKPQFVLVQPSTSQFVPIQMTIWLLRLGLDCSRYLQDSCFGVSAQVKMHMRFSIFIQIWPIWSTACPLEESRWLAWERLERISSTRVELFHSFTLMQAWTLAFRCRLLADHSSLTSWEGPQVRSLLNEWGFDIWSDPRQKVNMDSLSWPLPSHHLDFKPIVLCQSWRQWSLRLTRAFLQEGRMQSYTFAPKYPNTILAAYSPRMKL